MKKRKKYTFKKKTEEILEPVGIADELGPEESEDTMPEEAQTLTDPARAAELARRNQPQQPSVTPNPSIAPGDTTSGHGGITPE